MKDLSSGARRIILLTLVVGIFAMQVGAASVAVSPPRLTFTPGPGGYFEGEIEVYGAKDKDIRVKTYFLDWDFDPAGNVQFYSEQDRVQRSATAWLQLEPKEFLLPAKVKKHIKVWGRVPAGTEPGDYWSMFFVEFIPFSGLQTSGVKISGRVGGSVTITVPGMIVPTGRISSFTITYKTEEENPELGGKIIFENTGNGILEPTGRLEIKDLQNKLIGTVPIPPAKILPGAKREIELRHTLTLEQGKYIAIALLDYGGEKLAGYQRIFEVK